MPQHVEPLKSGNFEATQTFTSDASLCSPVWMSGCLVPLTVCVSSRICLGPSAIIRGIDDASGPINQHKRQSSGAVTQGFGNASLKGADAMQQADRGIGSQ